MAIVRRLSVLSLLVVLSLTASILLFLLFGELNSAFFEQTSLRLGGPVAAFFITLSLLWRMYRGAYFDENPLESRLKPLVGDWTIESTSSESGKVLRSRTNMHIDNGALCLDNGVFFAHANRGAEETAIGTWNVEMAISDGSRLKYFYTLTDNVANPVTWKGLVEAVLQVDPAGSTFYGTWQVLGRTFHSGTIVMRKENKPRGQK